MKKLTLVWAAIGLMCGITACNSSNNAGNTEPDTNKMAGDTVNKSISAAKNDDADAAFARKADTAGIAEIALAKLALAKSGDAQIKAFADMMVVDHTRANGELANLIKSKNIALTGTIDAQHQHIADSLKKLEGGAFDKGYAQVMIADHKKALNLMQQEAQNGKDGDFKTFAGKTAQIVQMHLDSIQKIQKALK